MSHLDQYLGACLLLIAYGMFLLHQAKKLQPLPRLNLALNATGSTLLALNAIGEQQPGILLLEGIWAIASLISLIRTVLSGHTGTPSAAAALAEHQDEPTSEPALDIRSEVIR